MPFLEKGAGKQKGAQYEKERDACMAGGNEGQQGRYGRADSAVSRDCAIRMEKNDQEDGPTSKRFEFGEK